MSEPVHGVEVVIYFKRLTAEGLVDKEYIGTLNGGAANQDLYTQMFPITTGVGVTTDDETLVNVFTDDGTPGTWTEYLDDGTDFLITGASGLVQIQAAENAGPNAGERIAIEYYTQFEMARGQSFDLTGARQLIEVWKLGSADVQDIIAGRKAAVGLTMIDLWVNRTMIGPFLSESDFYQKMTDVKVEIYPSGTGSGERYFTISEVKWENVTIGVSTDTLMEVTCGLKGKLLSSALVP